MSERELLDLLWQRLTRPVNGMTARYVMAEQVRHDPTYGAHIADAIAVDTWGSGRWELEGYEVKCSRSDWRRELPEGKWLDRDTKTLLDVPYVKSYPWRRHCRRWYVLAPKGVIPRDELPDGWGLIEASDGALRCTVKSAHFPDTTPLHPRQVAGLMRATAQTAIDHTRRAVTP